MKREGGGAHIFLKDRPIQIAPFIRKYSMQGREAQVPTTWEVKHTISRASSPTPRQ